MTATARRAKQMSIIDFLKADEDDLLGDLMASPTRTIKVLRAQVARLEVASPDMDFATADGIGCGDDWTDVNGLEDDDRQDALDANAAEISRVLRAARQRLLVAELLTEGRAELA